MVTLLDCIKKIPSQCESIISKYKQTFKELEDYLKNKSFNEIVFVGSGTSNTSTLTAVDYVEELSGLMVNHYLPNEIMNKKHLNKNALYVFVSQSGTSTLTNRVLEKFKNNKMFTIGICADEKSKMVDMCDVFINMHCKDEPYGMRTLGYVSTVITEIMLGLCIGKYLNNISNLEINDYLNDLVKVKLGISKAIVQAENWYTYNQEVLNDAKNIVIYGGKGLWGISLEGALKILEISRKVTSIGYEIDDGCHGPTMGYDNRYVVIVLNLNDENNKTAQSLARFAKGELKMGYIIGQNIIDDHDVLYEPCSTYFKCVEFAPFVQILAYNLALHYGIDLKPSGMGEPLPEKKYFNMHEN